MQIKTTVRYHLTRIRMAIIKKSTNGKCSRECIEKRTLLHSWRECWLVQPLWNTVWQFLRKLKIELPYDPAIPLLGIYPDKTIVPKDTCIVHNSQNIETSKCSLTNEWIKMMYLYKIAYHLVMKKNGRPFAATWMQLEIIILWSNSERERQIYYDITYMWNLKYDTNKPVYKTEKDSQTEQTCGCRGERVLEERKMGSLGSADVNCYIWDA